MKLRHSLVVPFVLLLSALVCAAPNSEMQEGANHLTSSIYTGPVMRTLRELSDGFGGRLTGSPAYTISRGKVVFEDDVVTGRPGHGLFVPGRVEA